MATPAPAAVDRSAESRFVRGLRLPDATLLVIGAVGYGLDLLLRGLRSRVGWE